MTLLDRHRERTEDQGRADSMRFGQLACVVMNSAGAKKRGGGEWKPGDFFDLGDDSVPVAQSEATMKHFARMWDTLWAARKRMSSA